jgi:hypothetical protein
MKSSLHILSYALAYPERPRAWSNYGGAQMPSHHGVAVCTSNYGGAQMLCQHPVAVCTSNYGGAQDPCQDIHVLSTSKLRCQDPHFVIDNFNIFGISVKNESWVFAMDAQKFREHVFFFSQTIFFLFSYNPRRVLSGCWRRETEPLYIYISIYISTYIYISHIYLSRYITAPFLSANT